MLGIIEGRRRMGRQRIIWLDGTTGSWDMSLSKFWDMMMDREVFYAIIHEVSKNQIQMND